MAHLWQNGQILDALTARIDPSDRGFTLGDGIFETMRLRNGLLCDAEGHWSRLSDSAGQLGIPLPDTGLTLLLQAVADLAVLDGLPNAVVRLTVTRGPAPRGLLPPKLLFPTLLISLAPLPAPAGPARLVIATSTRRNEFSPLSRIKSLNYLDHIIARREAEQRGADDALLLNSQGRITETTIANLFIVRNDQLLTPPLADGVLPGRCRAWLLATQGGQEQSLTPADLAQADELFLSNVLGLRPVMTLDGQPVGTGLPGPVFSRLVLAWANR